MKFVPHKFQLYCVERIINESALGLFLDMGLGKTSIILTAINDLKYNRFEIEKTLVIAPKKVAESTWGKEAAKWDHLNKLRISKVLGTATQRIKALNTPADVYIMNRENCRWLVEHYRDQWPFDVVVCDEFSSFKNSKSQRFKALTYVRKYIKRIYGLTGTPAPNGLIDLWSQVYLLDRGERLGKTIGGFRERYFDADDRDQYVVYSYKLKPGADNNIRELIGDICVSMSADDYLDLPDCTVVTVPVELDGAAKAQYKKFEREMILEVGDDTLEASTAAVLSNKLLQLCNGAIYDSSREVIEIHDAKIEAFLELIEGLNGQPVLVFYNFQHDLARIKKALKNLKVRELRTPQDEQDWNDRKIDVLLAHPASAAYGLNLQDGGNHIIWFGLSWNLELYQQANKRLHRQGQTQKVIIHHLVVSNGIDEDVALVLGDKGNVQAKLMNSLKARIERVRNG